MNVNWTIISISIGVGGLIFAGVKSYIEVKKYID